MAEVNAYPFMLSLRRRLAKALSPSPSGAISLNEQNVPLEVFDALFSKFGRESGPSRASQQLYRTASDAHSKKSKQEEDSSAPSASQIVTRVIWRKSEIDSLCKFQSVEPRRGFGASVLFPEAVGCAAVIPPLVVTHVRTSLGMQSLACNFSYAFLNSAAKIFQPPGHCLDISLWGATGMLIDPQGYIIDNISSYPSELKAAGVDVPEQVLRAAMVIRSSRHRVVDAKQEQEWKHALENWAAKAKKSSWESQTEYKVGFGGPQGNAQVITTS